MVTSAGSKSMLNYNDGNGSLWRTRKNTVNYDSDIYEWASVTMVNYSIVEKTPVMTVKN